MILIRSDLMALLPLIIVAANAVLVMLVAAFYRRPQPVIALTLLGLILSFAALPLAADFEPRQITPLLIVDSYALFYMGLVLAATFVVTVLCYRYFGGRESRHEALYILLLLAALGGVVLVASSHFASFLLGLELLSISLFALIAYPRNTERPLEAAIKYLVLAGFSSAFLLFGMALIYAQLGTMQFAQIGAMLAAPEQRLDAYGLAGIALIVAGVGFKLALVPFHMWTPDVYEGAPAPVTAFIATVSKGAMLAMLLRYFTAAEAHQSQSITLALSLIAATTILAGNLLALRQENIKRILAYSSIAQFGYLLVGFLAFGAMAVEAVAYYLAAYFVTMLGAFGVVTVLSEGAPERDSDTLADYSGLFWRRPWLAGVFTAMLLSLAGIPLTMGFIGKFYVLAAAVGASLWLLAIVVAVGSAIGLYYYLRIIAAMYAHDPKTAPGQQATRAVSASLAESVTLAALTLLLIWLGVYPALLIHMIETTVV
ncbi:NADH-quinone oxidoreductase subunit N [Nitrosospira sp. Nsp13]|uniref:NADH-quinone oxidoreductase subunit N n=1 Tax=Nitrosospira sp. Nsp13 TaxID=1855332 RepID=UPI000890C541|nr:NADH-quinone oxidoreductase subunit N [Nitrosospira sp. Nsp13]SCX80982.1 NADH dehydrogenase subunit N [Nitrosospira sp. Nsp13]